MKKIVILAAIAVMGLAGAEPRHQECGGVRLWEDGPEWAARNIGAVRPEVSGWFFWWGDTVGCRRAGNAWVANDGSNANISFTNDDATFLDFYTSVSALEIQGKAVDGVLVPEHDAAADALWATGKVHARVADALGAAGVEPDMRVSVTRWGGGGDLRLSVRVTNLWANRLIGDDIEHADDCEWKGGVVRGIKEMGIKAIPDWVKAGKPSPTGRCTFTTWKHWDKHDALMPSGLLGLVTVR